MIWSPLEGRVILSRDVTFDENTIFVFANKPEGETDDSTTAGFEQEIISDPTPQTQVRIQVEDDVPMNSPIVDTSQIDGAVVDKTTELESDHEETVVED